MTWWSLTRVLRDRVDDEVDASAPMREERRIARKAARGRKSILAWMYWLWIMGPAAMASFAGQSAINYVVAIVFLWTLAEMFVRAGQLHHALYEDSGLVVYEFIPISDAAIFLAQTKRFVRRTLWGLPAFVVGYALLLSFSGMGWGVMPGAVALGLAQWIFTVIISFCLMACVPLHLINAVVWLTILAGLACLWGGSTYPAVIEFGRHYAWVAPPLGWILQSLGVSGPEISILKIVPGLLTACVLAISPMAFRKVRQDFLNTETRHDSDGRSQEVIELGEEFANEKDEAAAAIRSRGFLAEVDWKSVGWIERVLSRWLGARERAIVEFMLAGRLNFTASFKRMVMLVLALGVPACLGIHFYGAYRLKAFLAGLGPMSVLFCIAVAVGSLTGARGFALPPEGGLTSPYFANYAIGFWELARTMLKINVLRTLLSLPFLAAIVGFAAEARGLNMVGTVIVKACATMIIAQPFIIIAAISPNTDDMKRTALVFKAAVLAVLGLVAGALFFLAPTWWVCWPSGVVFAGLAVLSLATYARWFNRSRFDLVPRVRPQI